MIERYSPSACVQRVKGSWKLELGQVGHPYIVLVVISPEPIEEKMAIHLEKNLIRLLRIPSKTIHISNILVV